jgi:hypothetical protein
MKNEASIIPIFAAAVVSVAVCLSLFWTNPVVTGVSGLAIFCLVVKVGWSISGTENAGGISVLNLAGLWLWLALTLWFGWLCL